MDWHLNAMFFEAKESGKCINWKVNQNHGVSCPRTNFTNLN